MLTPLTGTSANFGGPAVADNPLDEAGSFSATSDLLPPTEFPQFTSTASGVYKGGSGGVFAPVEGDWYVGALHTDDTYTRLGRTIDLSGVYCRGCTQSRLRTLLRYRSLDTTM